MEMFDSAPHWRVESLDLYTVVYIFRGECTLIDNQIFWDFRLENDIWILFEIARYLITWQLFAFDEFPVIKFIIDY